MSKTSRQDVRIAGVGMIPFSKPGTSHPYDEMGSLAVKAALQDAGLRYDQVQQAVAGYVYGDSGCGQKALFKVGMTGIPITNVNNNCSSGSTALYLARQAIAYGAADCVLAFGFEEMTPGALGNVFGDRPHPFDPFEKETNALTEPSEMPLTLRIFGGAGASHMEKYGTTMEDFAKVRAKASRHAKNNPLAVFRHELTPGDVMQSPELLPGVMTRLMACPPTCGAAAAILVSAEFAKKHNLSAPVAIKAQAMTTDTNSTFAARDMIQVVGYDVSKNAAGQAYEIAGLGPDDIDVLELHDCFAQNEVLTYEALQLCPEGGSQKFIADGDNTYGGKVVVNPSGGLLSKGHPLGATGLAQCYELNHQLRGDADARQVDGATIALQHNLGLSGSCVVTIYESV